MIDISDNEIEQVFLQIKKDAEANGYNLSADTAFVRDLVKGLLINEKRYGYRSCPCRLSTGKKEDDTDIICPCDYRDPDLAKYGACYCALYVTEEVLEGKKALGSIPESRPSLEVRRNKQINKPAANISNLPFPVYRCQVCGYLCARETPPEICPICKVKKDRFERFI